MRTRSADAATWAALAARPQSSATARTEVVKFLLDLEDGRRVWFADTEKYPVHFFFARDRIPHAVAVTRDREAFNRIQYREPGRRFEMGSIVHYVDSDAWTLELVGGDKLDGQRIVELHETLRGLLWIGDRLRFRPVSELHENAIAAVRGKLPLATTEEVFSALRYQPLTTGKTFGYLRLVRGTLDPTTVRADQILGARRVVGRNPRERGRDLARVAGAVGSHRHPLRHARARPTWRCAMRSIAGTSLPRTLLVAVIFGHPGH